MIDGAQRNADALASDAREVTLWILMTTWALAAMKRLYSVPLSAFSSALLNQLQAHRLGD